MVAIIIILTEDTEKLNSWSLTLRCLYECVQLDPWHGSPVGLSYSGVSGPSLPPWLYTRRIEGCCWWWPDPSVLVGTHFPYNLWCLLSATSNTFFLKPPPLLQTETKLKCITWNWGWQIAQSRLFENKFLCSWNLFPFTAGPSWSREKWANLALILCLHQITIGNSEL